MNKYEQRQPAGVTHSQQALVANGGDVKEDSIEIGDFYVSGFKFCPGKSKIMIGYVL
jgi:hypothetical protein